MAFFFELAELGASLTFGELFTLSICQSAMDDISHEEAKKRHVVAWYAHQGRQKNERTSCLNLISYQKDGSMFCQILAIEALLPPDQHSHGDRLEPSVLSHN